jgi:hypothetical protein
MALAKMLHVINNSVHDLRDTTHSVHEKMLQDCAR